MHVQVDIAIHSASAKINESITGCIRHSVTRPNMLLLRRKKGTSFMKPKIIFGLLVRLTKVSYQSLI